jgi:putative hydrolase of the HAD superfamily
VSARPASGRVPGPATRPGALLLDALGTLVALEPPAPTLQRELAERFGILVTEPQAAAAVAAEIAYYRAHFDEGRDAASIADLRGRCAEALRAALPSQDSIAELENAALTNALLASLRFRVFADARPAILAARARGQRVVVASNWDYSLHEVLARLGLAALLDGIVTSAEVGARKPLPAVFEHALRLAQATPAETIHVGDSLDEDVIGARAAGIEPVFLSRDGRSAPPAGVRVIGSLAELEDAAP